MPRIDPTLALYALILALGGALFVLIFWTMGAVNLYTGSGLINDMVMGDLARILYLSYPFVVAVCAAGALALYAMKQTTPAVGLAGLPIAGVVIYYLVLTVLHRG